jgi:hypothetical protein
MLALLERPGEAQRMVSPAYNLVKQEYDVTSAERQVGAILTRMGFSVAAGSAA